MCHHTHHGPKSTSQIPQHKYKLTTSCEKLHEFKLHNSEADACSLMSSVCGFTALKERISLFNNTGRLEMFSQVSFQSNYCFKCREIMIVVKQHFSTERARSAAKVFIRLKKREALLLLTCFAQILKKLLLLKQNPVCPLFEFLNIYTCTTLTHLYLTF